MAFRRGRVRVVAVWSLPEMSEEQLTHEVQNFLKLPIVEKNLLKFDLSLANDAFNDTLQPLGIQKPALNCVVIVEAETHEKINEIVRYPDFQKIFQGATQQGHLNVSGSAFFSADFMTGIDK
ncbi:hypothetical protein K438DRAFT_2008021 [Mycena galopus ATCC 62051]|nr:hypothetical protein K438DRAFT_2008021 [Mycena galopus ATCC 62051]